MQDPRSIIRESPRPLRRVEFDRLVREGCFESERIELLYGVLSPMSPNDPIHASAVHRIAKLLGRALGDRAEVLVQYPFAASDESEPGPDIAVVPPGDYRAAHPSVAWLVVEVAHSSLRKDRDVKARLYAESNVEEYWIVDVVARGVERFRTPIAGVYESHESLRESVTCLHFPDVRIAVEDML